MICPACQATTNDVDIYCAYCGWQIKVHPSQKDLENAVKHYRKLETSGLKR